MNYLQSSYCDDNRRKICDEMITVLYEPERVSCCLCPRAASFDGLPLYIFVPRPTISSKRMTYKATNK